jgi:hypothetical protein
MLFSYTLQTVPELDLHCFLRLSFCYICFCSSDDVHGMKISAPDTRPFASSSLGIIAACLIHVLLTKTRNQYFDIYNHPTVCWYDVTHFCRVCESRYGYQIGIHVQKFEYETTSVNARIPYAV